jgi:hypothetical protein
MARKAGLPDITIRQVRLEGVTPIMFDRYAGDNKTQLEPGEKMYFVPGTRTLCLPTMNVMSFLSAQNTDSVAKLIGGRGYKNIAQALLGFVQITPLYIPITRNGENIEFNGFVDDKDEKAGIYVDRRVARLAKGIPNPKVRPVVDLPWELSFTINLFKNDQIDEKLLKTAFMRGGMAIGLGTYRGLYGKFLVSEWSE